MLLDANLSQKFWAEAVSTAAYLQNRCPTHFLEEITPYEAMTLMLPSLEMKEESLMPKPKSVFYLDMVREQRATDYLTRVKARSFTVEMSDSMRLPRTMKIVSLMTAKNSLWL